MVSEMEARGSKTLLAGEAMREPSWLVWTLMKCSRVIVLTVLWAGLAWEWDCSANHRRGGVERHYSTDAGYEHAYRNVAIVAICSGAARFFGAAADDSAAEMKRKAGKHKAQ